MKFKESKSIYLQIADRINDEILQGQYTEEERILSVREYAATVEVNANTVVRTYDYLQGQEIIYNKRGIGYFVSAGAKDRIIALRKNIFPKVSMPRGRPGTWSISAAAIFHAFLMQSFCICFMT